MAEIRWTEESELWLREIYSYIATDDPNSAARVIDGIRTKIRALEDFPDMGFVYRTESEGPIRIVQYGHYRIAYIRLGETVNILGVFHGALDIERYI